MAGLVETLGSPCHFIPCPPLAIRPWRERWRQTRRWWQEDNFCSFLWISKWAKVHVSWKETATQKGENFDGVSGPHLKASLGPPYSMPSGWKSLSRPVSWARDGHPYCVITNSDMAVICISLIWFYPRINKLWSRASSKVSLGPAIPYHSFPCGRPAPSLPNKS
jgi:hypothetical protein